MAKFIDKFIDATNSFFALVMVLLGVLLSQVLKAAVLAPGTGWKDILAYITSPAFIVLAITAIFRTGSEELKGTKTPEAAAAKRANWFDRMERAFNRGFTYTISGTLAQVAITGGN